MLSKGGFFFNLDVDNIPGFHEVECFLNAADCLVCKIRKNEKYPGRRLCLPGASSSL